MDFMPPLLALTALLLPPHISTSPLVVPSPADEKQLVADDERAHACEAALVEAGKGGFSGAVLVSDKGEVLFTGGVGSSGINSDAEPNSAVTLFEVASLSKQFTAAAVLRLVQKRKLTLDDSIADHLPGVPDDCKEITVRHLLQHTSGIPGSNSRGGGLGLSVAIESFLKGGPTHKPGTHFEYWNQGYALLSAIVGRASKRDFLLYSRAEVFKRARLVSTGFTGDKPKRNQHVAIGRGESRSRGAYEHPYGSFGLQYRGMGGVVTNVWDLWRWDRALAGDRVLDEESKHAMFEPGLDGYALGWRIGDVAGEPMQHHGGDVSGFHCTMRRFPRRSATVIVLSNDDSSDVRGLASELTALLFDIDTTWGDSLAGNYVDGRGRSLRVSIDGGEVRANLTWGSGEGAPVTRGRILRTDDGGFRFDDGSEEIAVELEREDDEVIAIIIQVGNGLRFQR